MFNIFMQYSILYAKQKDLSENRQVRKTKGKPHPKNWTKEKEEGKDQKGQALGLLVLPSWGRHRPYTRSLSTR